MPPPRRPLISSTRLDGLKKIIRVRRIPWGAANPNILPGRWRALALLSITLILAMSTWFSASAVIAQLRVEWQLSPSAAAWMTIAVQLGFVGGALVSSLVNLPDLVSPRYVILGGALGAALANLLLLTAAGPLTGILLRLATGFFYAGVYPPALKLMSTWFRQGRGTALGILVGALTVGNALPHLVNGLGGMEWRGVIAATSLLTAAGGLLAAFAVRDGPFPFPKAVFDPRQAGRVLRSQPVLLALLGYTAHMWELYAMYAWFALFFAASLAASGQAAGAGAANASAAFAAFAVIVSGAGGCVAGGILADRWGRARTTALSMAISGSCALLIGRLFGSLPAWVLAVGLVWGISVVADSAQFSTLVTELADQSYVGTALTLQLAAGFTITAAAIWLIPLAQSAFGWQWAFAFLAPGPALGVWAMLQLQRLLAEGRHTP